MSFELTNTSAMFQKLINHVLYDYLNEFVIVYLNDILIYFKKKKNQEKNFYLKLKKYKFHKQQVEYLEHIITTKKLEMNSEKIKAVIEFLTSECVKNIQAFQELAEYY